MNIFQLKCFCKTVKYGGVTLAAEKLFITQPAVSKQLKLLEGEIGEKLYFKRGGKLVLTSIGDKVYHKASEIIRLFDALENNLNVEGDFTGEISVGCGPLGARFILPEIIKEFIGLCPEMNVSIFECESSEINTFLKTDVIDIALGFKPLKPDDMIKFEKLFSSRLVAICSSSLELPSKKIEITDILSFPFISYPPNSPIKYLLEPYLSKKETNIVLNSRSSETIIQYVQQGFGVSIVPQLLIRFLQPKDIHTIALDEEFWIDFGLFLDKAKFLQEGQLKFIELVKKQLMEAN
ncbi:MAG: LysR family transcriptional regulator [SAR324 cluster bacterium]|nr:LysR family transcriptional regulator [SAR324 cluster bacterium]